MSVKIQAYKNVVGIVGSRDVKDYYMVKKLIEEWEIENGSIDFIVSGGATGIDSMAVKYATQKEIPHLIFPAQWGKYGKKAGPMRNTLIVESGINHLIAFPSQKSKGTWNIINQAKGKNGIKVHITKIQLGKVTTSPKIAVLKKRPKTKGMIYTSNIEKRVKTEI